MRGGNQAAMAAGTPTSTQRECKRNHLLSFYKSTAWILLWSLTESLKNQAVMLQKKRKTKERKMEDKGLKNYKTLKSFRPKIIVLLSWLLPLDVLDLKPLHLLSAVQCRRRIKRTRRWRRR